MRAAVFAVVGSVPAVSGHYAVADGVTPWRPTVLLVLAQCRRLSRRASPTIDQFLGLLPRGQPLHT